MGDNWAWLEQRQMFSLGRIFVPTLVKSNPISVSLSLHGSGETAHTISVWEGRSGRERDVKKYFHQKIWVTGNRGSIWVACAKRVSLKAVYYVHIRVHIYAGVYTFLLREKYNYIHTFSLCHWICPVLSVRLRSVCEIFFIYRVWLLLLMIELFTWEYLSRLGRRILSIKCSPLTIWKLNSN